MRPDEDEDKFDHDPDGTGWELNTSEMTPKHMRDIPRRIRCLPFDVPWSQKTADSLAEEVALVVEMALLPPNAGADIAAKAGVNAALANLGRALKAEARIEALEKAICDELCECGSFEDTAEDEHDGDCPYRKFSAALRGEEE